MNLTPLSEEQIKLEREKMERLTNQRNFIKSFLFYSLFLVVLFTMSYYNLNQYSHEYGSQLNKLFSIDKQVKSVRIKL